MRWWCRHRDSKGICMRFLYSMFQGLRKAFNELELSPWRMERSHLSFLSRRRIRCIPVGWEKELLKERSVEGGQVRVLSATLLNSEHLILNTYSGCREDSTKENNPLPNGACIFFGKRDSKHEKHIRRWQSRKGYETSYGYGYFYLKQGV